MILFDIVIISDKSAFTDAADDGDSTSPSYQNSSASLNKSDALSILDEKDGFFVIKGKPYPSDDGEDRYHELKRKLRLHNVERYGEKAIERQNGTYGPIHYYVFDIIRYEGQNIQEKGTLDRIENYLYNCIKEAQTSF